MRKRNIVLATVIGLIAASLYLAPATTAMAARTATAVTHQQGTSAASAFWFKTSSTYQGHPVWTNSQSTCMGEVIWRECMSWRVYENGISAWGAAHTLGSPALRGAHLCHSDGSYGYGFWYKPLSCGEHNLTSGRLKMWYSFDECTSIAGLPQCNYRAMHIYVYASGLITGPYAGLGA